MRERALSWVDHRAEGIARVIAAQWRATVGRRTRLIAVTGTFGKSTATRAIAAALGESSDRPVFENAYGRLYGNLIRMTGFRPLAVLEIGIGRPGQMRRHAAAFRPDVAVVTSIGDEHAQKFPDGVDGIEREKGDLVAALPSDGWAVLNADDPRVLSMADRTEAGVVTFGRPAGVTVRLTDLQTRMDGSRLQIEVGPDTYVLEIQIVGPTGASAVLAAVAVAHAVGLDMGAAIAGLEALKPTTRRLEPVLLPNGVPALLDDSKGTPGTAIAAFEAMAGMTAERRIGVLGNIPTTWTNRWESYMELGEHAGRTFDRIYLTSLVDEDFEPYRAGILSSGFPEGQLSRLSDVYEAAATLERELRDGDVVLFKAHLTDKFSRTVLRLQGIPVTCGKTSCLMRANRWCDKCPNAFAG